MNFDAFDAFSTWFRGPRAKDDNGGGSRASSVTGASTVSVPTELPDDPQTLKTIIKRLKQENATLKSRTTSYVSRGALLRDGLLYMETDTSLFFSESWVLRYFVLSGDTLVYYADEGAEKSSTPLGFKRVGGTRVLVEGPKKHGHYWAFFVDADAETPVRLSTESKSDLDGWVRALERIGCKVEFMSDELRPPARQSRRGIAAAGEPEGLDRTGSSSRRQSLGQRRGHADEVANATPVLPRTPVKESPAKGGDSARGEPGDGPGGAGKGGAGEGDNATTSAVTIEETVQRHKRKRGDMRGSTPLHRRSVFSPLSSERTAELNTEGLVNLCAVVLLAANFRLILENIRKYGLLSKPFEWLRITEVHPRLMASWLSLPTLAMGSLMVEKWAALRLSKEKGNKRARRLTETLTVTCQAVLTTLTVALPCLAMAFEKGDPAILAMPGFFLISSAVVLWMKLVSYAHCCADCRVLRRQGAALPGEPGCEATLEDVPAGQGTYPDNLTVQNMLYFMAAPTLTYQVAYPRTPKIRYKWLARRVAEAVVTAALLVFLIQQYIEPAVSNSLVPFDQMDLSLIVERILKISLPMLYVWLTGSYLLFHLLLNISAEVLRFGDREFYRDWWNAHTLEDYWRLWNMPVHRWMLRTVYFPCMRAGLGKSGSVFAVFFVSAVFHELVVGVPLRLFRAWAFLGIMFQIPLIMLTQWMDARLKNKRLGNIVFWVSFCIVGQPIAVLMYYHDFRAIYYPNTAAAAAITGPIAGSNLGGTAGAGHIAPAMHAPGASGGAGAVGVH